jgi:hypothetical protein
MLILVSLTTEQEDPAILRNSVLRLRVWYISPYTSIGWKDALSGTGHIQIRTAESLIPLGNPDVCSHLHRPLLAQSNSEQNSRSSEQPQSMQSMSLSPAQP